MILWMKKRMKFQRGFTLFEVLIAMTIMSSASILLYTAWAGNQVRVQKIVINNQAAFLLDQIMGELQIKYGQRFEQLPEAENGIFKDNPKFSWKMESKDFEMPDLRAILMKDDRDNNEMMMMMIDKLTEYLNQSIKEMKVTVQYTAGKKSVQYSATTFMVDYNRNIPLGVPGMGGGGGNPLNPGGGGG